MLIGEMANSSDTAGRDKRYNLSIKTVKHGGQETQTNNAPLKCANRIFIYINAVMG